MLVGHLQQFPMLISVRVQHPLSQAERFMYWERPTWIMVREAGGQAKGALEGKREESRKYGPKIDG